MRQPEDELLIALSHGMEGWMLGTAIDALEIASYVQATGNRAIPQTPEAIDHVLSDMHDAGLVFHRSRPPDVSMPPKIDPGLQSYRSYALTKDGWARAREIEAAEQEPPPQAADP